MALHSCCEMYGLAELLYSSCDYRTITSITCCTCCTESKLVFFYFIYFLFKIMAIISVKGGTVLGIDNAKLAADDYRVK